MFKIFKFLQLVILFLLLVLSTGCWSRNEVENLAIASAIGIDKVEQSGEKQILFSVLIVKPESKSGGDPAGTSGGGGGGVPGWINFAQGNSVDDAQRNLFTTTSTKPFLGHSRIIILGDETAKDGVGDIIDYLERNKDIRLRNWVLVTKGTALEIFGIHPELENLLSEEVNNLLTLSAPDVSKSYAVDLKEFLVDLATPGKEAVLPLLETREIPANLAFGIQEGSQADTRKNARLKGLAVFKEDKKVGELGDTETKGFLWVVGKAQRGALTFQVPNSGTPKNVQVTIDMTRANSEIQTQVIRGKPAVTVKIEAEGNIREFSQPNVSVTPEDVEEIDKGFAAEIKRQATMAILKCQKDLKSDIFGFGTSFHRQQVNYWKEYKLEENWTQVFPEVPVKLEVKANVRRSGLTSDSIQIK
ncbi:MAG: Ger(x)C family spore germination protein [Dehalobacterium sp.]